MKSARIQATLASSIILFSFLGSAVMRAEPLAMRRVMLIFNPNAGSHQSAELAQKVADALKQKGVEAELAPTKAAGHAVELAAAADKKNIDVVCAIGGDGTVNEVSTGLMRQAKELRPVLAVIPGGTGNAFATDIERNTAEQAIAALLKAEPRPVDVALSNFVNMQGKNEERATINLIGLGLGVDANATAEELRWMGPARYNAGILWQILRNNSYRIRMEIDGVAEEGDFSIIMVQNTVHGGNKLKLAPQAQIDDGYLDLITAPHLSRRDTMALFHKVKKDGAHIKSPKVRSTRFKHLKVSAPNPLLINIDGENCGTTPLEVKVLHKELLVL